MQLVKRKTGFIVSFMFAGPDPRNDWDMISLLWATIYVWNILFWDSHWVMFSRCHPSETPQGKTFTQLYQAADKDFLDAFQQYAEIIFDVFLIYKSLVDSLNLYYAASDKHKPKLNIAVGNEDIECGEEFKMYGEEEPNDNDDAEEHKDTESFSQGEEEQDDCKDE